MHRAITRILVPATLAVGVLSGCAVQEPTYPPTTGAVLGAPGPRTVEYPGGRVPALRRRHDRVAVLLGVGPGGHESAAAARAPPTRVATAATEGRYQLYGDGSTSSPYYWVWVPAGTTVVPPPPPPRRP